MNPQNANRTCLDLPPLPAAAGGKDLPYCYTMADGWDAMEGSVSGDGCRPTIGAMMWSEALAIATVANSTGAAKRRLFCSIFMPKSPNKKFGKTGLGQTNRRKVEKGSVSAQVTTRRWRQSLSSVRDGSASGTWRTCGARRHSSSVCTSKGQSSPRWAAALRTRGRIRRTAAAAASRQAPGRSPVRENGVSSFQCSFCSSRACLGKSSFSHLISRNTVVFCRPLRELHRVPSRVGL
jgi:hypothetical protein